MSKTDFLLSYSTVHRIWPIHKDVLLTLKEKKTTKPADVQKAGVPGRATDIALSGNASLNEETDNFNFL